MPSSAEGLAQHTVSAIPSPTVACFREQTHCATRCTNPPSGFRKQQPVSKWVKIGWLYVIVVIVVNPLLFSSPPRVLFRSKPDLLRTCSGFVFENERKVALALRLVSESSDSMCICTSYVMNIALVPVFVHSTRHRENRKFTCQFLDRLTHPLYSAQHVFQLDPWILDSSVHSISMLTS